MDVEQAIFASTNRGNIKGYQVVSSSSGVSGLLQRELSRWAPTQLPGATSGWWTVSSFPLLNDWVGISRSVVGGPEYSDRGGMNIVTMFLLLKQKQYEVYDRNAIALAKLAMALGHLRLPIDLNQSSLPQIELPERQLIACRNRASDKAGDMALQRVLECIDNSKRAVVIGCARPIRMLELLIPRIAPKSSREFSFTTGLLPSARRPFSLHFLAGTDASMERTLGAQDIVSVSAN